MSLPVYAQFILSGLGLIAFALLVTTFPRKTR